MFGYDIRKNFICSGLYSNNIFFPLVMSPFVGIILTKA